MKKKYLAVILSVALLLGSVPETVFAEPTEDADGLVRIDVLQVGDADALTEPIAYTEDGEPIYGGYIETSEDSNAPALQNEKLENEVLTDTTIPAVYNPKEQDCGYTLPEIRNQNPYGTCWAFGTIAPMELSLIRQYNETRDLSELQLAYFTYHGGTDPLGGTEGDSVTYLSSAPTSYLNLGGNISYSATALMNWRGAADEADVPYGNASSTISNGLNTAYEYNKDTAHLQSFYKINIRTDSQAVKKAIMTYGAVGESYYHNNTYYKASTNAYCNNTNTSTNHAITLVGWDDNFSKTNFKNQPEHDGAWLVRNSWGSDNMSIYGYFWISYEDTSLRDTVYAFDAEPASNYDHNYQYDGSIESMSIGMADSFTAANVFTVKANEWEELKAVSVSVPNNAQLDYTIKIYKNPVDASNPESGTLISDATTTGTTAFAGSYTIKLKKSVLLKKGDTFSTVVELKKSGSQVSIGVEASDTLVDSVQFVASAKAGESFYKLGDSWKDYGVSYGRNLRIKAYTSDTIAPVNGSLVNNLNGNFFYLGDDGKLRCYDNNYKMIIDSFVFDGSYTYYMQTDGTPMMDRLTYHPDGEHIIYFDKNGHEVFTNFQYCPSVGYTCYFDSQGYLYKDTITFVGSNVYYLNGNGALEQNGWFQFANGMDYGYASYDGTLVTTGFSYDLYGRVVFYHWNGMVARGLISDGVYYYSMDMTDGHYLGQFLVEK